MESSGTESILSVILILKHVVIDRSCVYEQSRFSYTHKDVEYNIINSTYIVEVNIRVPL